MKITDLLKVEGIKIGASAKDKSDAIDQLVALMCREGNVKDADAYKAAVHAREEESTTAIGDGIAIPHAKTDAVSAPGLAAMTVPAGVDYDSPDGEDSDLFFLIAAPNTKDNVHLDVLSRLSELLMDDDFTAKLRAAKTPEEFRGVIDAAENEKVEADGAKSYSGVDIVAVTACPTGIAHTYMAAEALEKKAKEMGIVLKAETQGQSGAKNVLTAEEIAGAKGVIIAADKKIDLARFAGKQVLLKPVSDGINKPADLINTVMDGKAPVLEGSAAASTASAAANEGMGRKIYKALMNGVSHMLPFVVGGGILIAISFLIDGIINPSAGSSLGSSTPAALFFNQAGNAAFAFMLPVLAGFIAMAIADRPGLAVGFTGGSLASLGYSWTWLVEKTSGAENPTAISGGFLGALFAGFAAGLLVLLIKKACDKLPDSLEGIKPILLYPLFGILLIAVVMFTVNPVFAWINTAMTNVLKSMGTSNLVLLGAVVGGMMSIDMGGPFNKAAYVFGVGMLAEGTTAGMTIMASVMVGGMVPPIVIALSTTFFKNRWTSEDRKAGIVNYIMGISFISEGAIPYAAADPGHVLPSCIIGSAVAGALSAAFGCTSPAPHGGLWVFPILGNWPMFILALLVGSVVGCLILSLWKKKLPAEESGLAK